MEYSPHPLLRSGDLAFAPSSARLAAIREARELLFFFNARAALFNVFMHLKTARRERVLMPAFHCVSMIEPALHAGLEVTYYRVDRHLRIDMDDVFARVSADVCAFVFVNFFGVPASIETLVPELRRRNIAVVEDCSHSFLRLNPFGLTGGRGDFSVYSFAKLVPSGVGGGLLANGTRFELPELTQPPLQDSVVRSKRLLEQAVLSASRQSLIRKAYIALESTRVRFRSRGRARQGESGAPEVAPTNSQYAAGALAFDPQRARTRFPALPRHILRAANLREIAARRRQNYLRYGEQLASLQSPIAVFPALGDEVCPWAYPVLLGERSKHDVRLRSLGVPVWTFGDQLHPSVESAGSVAATKDARFLAAHLLCLPVHQGLPPEVVSEFARTIATAKLPSVPDTCA